MNIKRKSPSKEKNKPNKRKITDEDILIELAMRDFRPKTKFNITINDFKTLLTTKMLSDNIIDFYLDLLVQNNHNLYAFYTKF